MLIESFRFITLSLSDSSVQSAVAYTVNAMMIHSLDASMSAGSEIAPLIFLAMHATPSEEGKIKMPFSLSLSLSPSPPLPPSLPPSLFPPSLSPSPLPPSHYLILFYPLSLSRPLPPFLSPPSLSLSYLILSSVPLPLSSSLSSLSLPHPSLSLPLSPLPPFHSFSLSFRPILKSHCQTVGGVLARAGTQ